MQGQYDRQIETCAKHGINVARRHYFSDEVAALHEHTARDASQVGHDRMHGRDQCAAQAGPRRQVEQGVVACGLGQHQSAALDEVALDQRTLGASARRLRGLNGLQGGLLTVDGVPQKNHAQHGHGIFGGREVGVGPELIGGVPQAGFNLRDVVEGVGGHLCGG